MNVVVYSLELSVPSVIIQYIVWLPVSLHGELKLQLTSSVPSIVEPHRL